MILVTVHYGNFAEGYEQDSAADAAVLVEWLLGGELPSKIEFEDMGDE